MSFIVDYAKAVREKRQGQVKLGLRKIKKGARWPVACDKPSYVSARDVKRGWTTNLCKNCGHWKAEHEVADLLLSATKHFVSFSVERIK